MADLSVAQRRDVVAGKDEAGWLTAAERDGRTVATHGGEGRVRVEPDDPKGQKALYVPKSPPRKRPDTRGMPGQPASMPPKPCIDAPLPEEDVYERSLKNSFYTHARGAAPTPSKVVSKVVRNMFSP